MRTSFRRRFSTQTFRFRLRSLYKRLKTPAKRWRFEYIREEKIGIERIIIYKLLNERKEEKVRDTSKVGHTCYLIKGKLCTFSPFSPYYIQSSINPTSLTRFRSGGRQKLVITPTVNEIRPSTWFS